MRGRPAPHADFFSSPALTGNILKRNRTFSRSIRSSSDRAPFFIPRISAICFVAGRVFAAAQLCASGIGRGTVLVADRESPPNPDEPRILFLQKARGTKKVKAFDTDNDGLTLMNNQILHNSISVNQRQRSFLIPV